MKKTSTLLAIGSALAMSSAQAEIDAEFHVGYNSQYTFRGVDLGSDAFEWGIDVSGSCDCGLDWSAGIWSISPDNEDGNVDEFDIYGEISKDLGWGSLAVGFTNYSYDDSGAPAGSAGTDDSEVYVGLAADLAGLNAGLTLFYGLDGILTDQVLLEGSLAYGFDLSEKASAELSVTIGYIADDGNNGYAIDDGYAYSNFSFSIDYAVSDAISFSPYVTYTDGDDDVLGAGVGFSGLYGGVKVGYTF